jgi:hypothetical protein
VSANSGFTAVGDQTFIEYISEPSYIEHADKDDPFAAGVSIYFKVAAVNSNGEGPASAVVKATVPGSGGTLPAAPTGVTATASGAGQITVNWGSVTGATSYTVYNSLDANAEYVYPIEGAENVTTTSIINQNLDAYAGMTVYYWVSATTSAGESALSSPAAYAVVPGGSVNMSLDGKWQLSDFTVSINGNTGVWSQISRTSALTNSAIDKGYIKAGAAYLRNLTKTGTDTWTGQVLTILAYNSAPTVAVNTQWNNCTIKMASDGLSFTCTYSTSNEGSLTKTYTRILQ